MLFPQYMLIKHQSAVWNYLFEYVCQMKKWSLFG